MHCLNQCTATEGGERKARKNILSHAFSYQNPLWSRAISPSWGVAHMFSYSFLCSPSRRTARSRAIPAHALQVLLSFTIILLSTFQFVVKMLQNSENKHQGLFLKGLIFRGAYLWSEICIYKSIGLPL